MKHILHAAPSSRAVQLLLEKARRDARTELALSALLAKDVDAYLREILAQNWPLMARITRRKERR